MDSSLVEQTDQSPRAPRASAFGLAALYAVVAGLWIILSDRLLLIFMDDPTNLAWLQTVKGWGFVAVTAVLLYAERLANENARRRADLALRRRTAELQQANRDLQVHTDVLCRANDLLTEAERIAHVGSWNYDIAQNKLTWSDETFRIFGVVPEEFDGRIEAFYRLIHPEDLAGIREANQDAITRHVPLDIEHRVIQRDGSPRIVHERGYTVYDDTGRPVRLFGMVQDITERTHSEEGLRQQGRLAVVGQMAAGIAHDFNNILAVIMLYTQMLQLTSQNENEKRHLATIYQQSVHAANLVEQILDFSRRSSMERIPLDIVPFVKEMVKLWQRTLPEHIRIEMICESQSLTVRADPARLQQALMNIVINARDAMPNGGLLRLELGALLPGPNSLPPWPSPPSGAWLRLIVSDTGSGIPAEVMPHLFEPFFTTKPPGKGTGLGLSQVYGIVQQLEGQIQVESVVGEGTQFMIYLPLLAQSNVQSMGAAPMHPPHGHGELVLLVEDEDALREAVKEMLTGLGYHVITASNGVAALSAYAAHGGAFALVLSDLIMPDMGGLELHRELIRLDPQSRILLVTGYPREQETEFAENLQWIQKPFTMDTLAQRVADAIYRDPSFHD